MKKRELEDWYSPGARTPWGYQTDGAARRLHEREAHLASLSGEAFLAAVGAPVVGHQITYAGGEENFIRPRAMVTAVAASDRDLVETMEGAKWPLAWRLSAAREILVRHGKKPWTSGTKWWAHGVPAAAEELLAAQVPA